MRGGRRGDGGRRGPAGRDPLRAPARTTGSPTPPAGVRVGEFGRAHGVRGEVRLKSLTQDPFTIGRLGPLAADDGRTITLLDLRAAPGGSPDMLIARVDGVGDRSAAEALTRVSLYAPRAALATQDAPDEWLVEDLIGLRVDDEAGALVGTVVAVPDFGAGDLVEIAPPGGGRTAYLPFTRAFVPTVDVPGGRIVVRAPADLFAPPRPAPDEEDAGDAGEGVP